MPRTLYKSMYRSLTPSRWAILEIISGLQCAVVYFILVSKAIIRYMCIKKVTNKYSYTFDSKS